MNAPTTLTELAAAWRAAKAAEAQAASERKQIEEAMLAFIPAQDEGTVTVDGVVATFKMTRKVDTDHLQAAWENLPEHAQRCFRWKAEVDTKALRAVASLDQAAYRVAAEFVTATPARPAITIKD